MSEENKIGGPNAETGFEREDWSAHTVFYFFLGLAAGCVLVFFVLRGAYAYLETRARESQPPQNPLVTAPPVTERNQPRAEVQSEIRSTFPEPRLEENERQEITDFRLHEEETLSSYGWVDQRAGVVRVPIERAMQLVAQRGLPVKAETDHAGTAAQASPERNREGRAAERSTVKQP